MVRNHPTHEESDVLAALRSLPPVQRAGIELTILRLAHLQPVITRTSRTKNVVPLVLRHRT